MCKSNSATASDGTPGSKLANAIFEYLEIHHNRQRRPSSLGMLSPIEYVFRHHQHARDQASLTERNPGHARASTDPRAVQTGQVPRRERQGRAVFLCELSALDWSLPPRGHRGAGEDLGVTQAGESRTSKRERARPSSTFVEHDGLWLSGNASIGDRATRPSLIANTGHRQGSGPGSRARTECWAPSARDIWRWRLHPPWCTGAAAGIVRLLQGEPHRWIKAISGGRRPRKRL